MVNLKTKISSFMLGAIIFASSSIFVEAKNFDEKAETKTPLLLHKWCDFSAQELVKTYKTNYVAHLSDGQDKQYASLRFLASDFDAIRERIKSIEVIDAKSEKLIDAQQAFFVINSNAKTSYTSHSKLAFEKEDDAKEFVGKYGGDIRDFAFSLYVATKDIALDEKYFEKKREAEYKKGQKIYESVCKKIDPNTYSSLVSLKSDIENRQLCTNLSETYLQNVSIYLWDIKRFGELANNTQIMKVPQQSKCPVCGMFVAKYPKWAAKVKIKEHTHYFDGVKDMMKFYFNPPKYGHPLKSSKFESVKVTDYYTQNEIDGIKAWFVLHSNVYGPMGNELIPFEKKEDAESFLKEHNGKILINFSQITEQAVYDLDK